MDGIVDFTEPNLSVVVNDLSLSTKAAFREMVSAFLSIRVRFVHCSPFFEESSPPRSRIRLKAERFDEILPAQL
jgi:hypothetical protein